MAIVYRHRRLDTFEVFYIGVGKNKKRAYDMRSRNKYWHNIVKKHGYYVEILIYKISYKDALELEILLIEEYGRKDLDSGCLVNMTNGGEGSVGFKHSIESKIKMGITSRRENLSEETLNKMRESSKRENLTAETRKKLSESSKNISDETRLKMSKSSKGRIFSEEHKKKISESNKGKVFSKKTRDKMSKASKIRSRTKEARKKVSDYKSIKISQYTLDGYFIKHWKSATQAASSLKGFNTHINRCCRGKAKTAYGFIWKYA